MPFTGQETVLDALNYANGLTSTADPNNIRLVRPARGEQPAKTYTIDLAAIRDEGDPTANLQIFPGDRLIVGRHQAVEATLAIDRMSAGLNTLTQMLITSASALRVLNLAIGDKPLTLEQREAIVDSWVEFWWSVIQQRGDAALDKEALRKSLERTLIPDAETPETDEAK